MALAGFLAEFAAWAESAVGDWGYLGIFTVSLLGNLTILFPLPAFIVVFATGAVLNPWLVGLAGGLGGALGETTGYLLGRGGREAVKGRYASHLRRAQTWTLRHGMFWVIIFFAVTPLPSDVIGILAGLLRYSYRKFLLGMAIGKIVLNIIIAWAGFYGIQWALGLFSG